MWIKGLVVLAAGDHNGDGSDDLAVGLPLADLIFTCGPPRLFYYCNSAADGGQVSVFKGGGSGLSLYKTYTQGNGKADEGDQFGRSLAFGDFDNDGYDDLAVGVPFEDEGSGVDAGAVSIFYDLPSPASASQSDDHASGFERRSGREPRPLRLGPGRRRASTLMAT